MEIKNFSTTYNLLAVPSVLIFFLIVFVFCVLYVAYSLMLQIQLLVQDLNKQYRKYQKSYHKYSKLVKDAEVSIKAREEAIIQFAAKVNRSAEKEASSQDMTSYLNRGLSKMISKIIPTEDFKSIHDRCRSLLSEMEDLELNLMLQSDRMSKLHKQLQDKALGMTTQMELLEEQRLENTKDGLLRFCQASEGMLEHNKNILENLRGLTIAAAADSTPDTGFSRAGSGDESSSPLSGRSEDMATLEMELALLINIMQDTDATYDQRSTSQNHNNSGNSNNQNIGELVSILSEEGEDHKPKEIDFSVGDLELKIEIHLHTFEKLKNALSILGNINYEVRDGLTSAAGAAAA